MQFELSYFYLSFLFVLFISISFLDKVNALDGTCEAWYKFAKKARLIIAAAVGLGWEILDEVGLCPKV